MVDLDKPTLIVGDIHGNKKLLKDTINYAHSRGYNYVQIGDLLDSFEFSNASQLDCLKIANEAVKEDNTVFLKGNHELSYLVPSLYKCSGFSKNRYNIFISELRSLPLKDFVLIDDVLITHAGLSQLFLTKFGSKKANDGDKEDLRKELSLWLENPHHPIYNPGLASGGHQSVGGIFWCRPTVFEPVKDLTQVFGHTFVEVVEDNKEKNYYNIDTLQHYKEILLYDTNKEFHILPLEEYVR